ncbi:hypothetical protein NDU88_002682 [Pleurodeles waltl]|uniref:Uncharacterized protein n=1 Tax=Pleurodeles waltl TaxID=8319 RepID=A0AAV7P7C6_PLEWA|nr:hypothetical protein NDU88_002682 [Pleurodeles waltl]
MGGVAERNLAVGDWVRTNNWEESKKGLSRWSVPKRITKVSKYSVVVDDGRKWNVGNVVKCNEMEMRKWKNVACEHGDQGGGEENKELNHHDLHKPDTHTVGGRHTEETRQQQDVETKHAGQRRKGPSSSSWTSETVPVSPAPRNSS